MHGIKAFICLPFGLDFQTGQTFIEMAQTVQINLMSHEEGSLHYSRSDEHTATALTLKTTSPSIRVSSGHRLESVSSIKGPGDRHGDPINPCTVSTPAGWLLIPATQTNRVLPGPPCAVYLCWVNHSQSPPVPLPLCRASYGLWGQKWPCPGSQDSVGPSFSPVAAQLKSGLSDVGLTVYTEYYLIFS